MNDIQKKVLDLLNEDCRIPMEKMAVMLNICLLYTSDAADE